MILEKNVLTAKDLVKRYEVGDNVVMALDGIDLNVQPGEYLAIMGPSGSGKTTLLDVLSCVLRPSTGKVYIHNQLVSGMNDEELARIRGKTIGFVFQSFNLIGRLTAKENVMLPLWFQGIPKKERETIAIEMLKNVGLEKRMHHKPNELSGGQKQRVAIARALAVNPEIIVADEPTGNLDSESGEKILEIIQELNQNQKKTIIMVTHERYVAEHAKRIIYLKDGKIIKEEKKPEKRTKNAF
ncbi:ABC transporter ATP-binding protein [Candidatus Micrarchaeota archaeon]|nr:ABC transporter ATP-binding protein [Candidatus Micrarchaeota archaeon]MBU1930835.1 ABC transporter ATP-binding protein [Candidatus Micrarchaeota archaeon]